MCLPINKVLYKTVHFYKCDTFHTLFSKYLIQVKYIVLLRAKMVNGKKDGICTLMHLFLFLFKDLKKEDLYIK